MGAVKPPSRTNCFILVHLILSRSPVSSCSRNTIVPTIDPKNRQECANINYRIEMENEEKLLSFLTLSPRSEKRDSVRNEETAIQIADTLVDNDNHS